MSVNNHSGLMMQPLYDAVFDLDADGRVAALVLDDGSNVLRRNGLEPGLEFGVFLGAEVRGPFRDALERVVHGGGPVEFHGTATREGWWALRMKLSLRSTPPCDGCVEDPHVLVQDVTGAGSLGTHRSPARGKSEDFASVANSLPVFLLEFSSAGQWMWANRACLETLEPSSLPGLREGLPAPGDGWKDIQLQSKTGIAFDTSWSFSANACGATVPNSASIWRSASPSRAAPCKWPRFSSIW